MMEYLWAFLIFVGFFALTTILTGILRLLVPIMYLLLGFILGVESVIMGIAGVLGCFVTIYNAKKYIRTHGAMSHAPRYSIYSSIGFIVVFIVTVVLKYAFKVEMNNINYWYLLGFAVVVWIVLRFIFIKFRNMTHSQNNFMQNVIKFKIVEKYDNDPKWATYLYYNNEEEGWNQTIPGSFLAKNPENDFTFVHNTKDDALKYAKRTFENAEFVDEEILNKKIILCIG